MNYLLLQIYGEAYHQFSCLDKPDMCGDSSKEGRWRYGSEGERIGERWGEIEGRGMCGDRGVVERET